MTITGRSTRQRTGRGTTARSAALVAAASLLTGCIAIRGQHGATTTAGRTVAGVTSLRVTTRNGAVTVIEDAAVQGAVVSAEIRCFADSMDAAEKRAAAATLVTESDARGVTQVRVEFPAPASTQDSASIEIRVASVAQLDLETSNGRITVKGLAGPLTAKTSNGAVEIADHDGPLTLESSNGRIAVTGATASVDAKSSNGAIGVAFAPDRPSASTAEVNARTSNGRIEISMPATWVGTITGSTSNGRVALQVPGSDGVPREVTANRTATTSVGNGTAQVKASTSNGAVTVKVGG